MKKRIFALSCIIALCLAAFCLPTRAASTPCFMAVNDSLLPLEDQFIPIELSGQYYMPYTVLDSNVTGLSLEIYPLYNSVSSTLMIYNKDQALFFDLASGTCTDRSGTSHSIRLIIRNGRIYVPARFTSEFFGLKYSAWNTEYGPLIRLCSSSAKLDDSNFISQAQLQMESRLREWQASQAPAETPTPAPTPTPTPRPASTSTPRPTPTLSPSPTPVPPSPSVSVEPDPEIDKSDVRTYLAFRAEQTDGLDELLALLEQNRLHALFFFPAEGLAEYDDAVRKVLCGGHAVGLLADGPSGEEAAAQAEEGNRLLAQIAHLYTNIVLADGAAGAGQAWVDAGLLCLRPDVDALPDGRSAYRQSSAVLQSAASYRGQVVVLSDASAAGAALAAQFLPGLIQDKYDIRLMVETEFPPRS